MFFTPSWPEPQPKEVRWMASVLGEWKNVSAADLGEGVTAWPCAFCCLLAGGGTLIT